MCQPVISNFKQLDSVIEGDGDPLAYQLGPRQIVDFSVSLVLQVRFKLLLIVLVKIWQISSLNFPDESKIVVADRAKTIWVQRVPGDCIYLILVSESLEHLHWAPLVK